MVKPRLFTPRREDRPTRGDRVDAYMQALGFTPHDWQSFMASVFCEEDPATGLLWYRQCGAEVSRQSGKTQWIVGRVLQQCLDYPRQYVGFTSQDRNNAVRAFWEHTALIEDSPLADQIARSVRRSGMERMEFVNGSVYEPLTPNRHGSRGRSLDLAIIDEALKHDAVLLSALGPTLSARPGSQLVMLSNAGDDDSELLTNMRETTLPTLGDPEAHRAWMEWSLDPDAEGFDPYDETCWYQAMPTLGKPNGLQIDFVREMARVMERSDFCREYLCIPSSNVAQLVIMPATWARLYRTDVMLGDEVVLGIDVTPSRDAAAIVAAGRVGEYLAVEVIEAMDGTGWLLDRVLDVAKRWEAPVALDQGGPAGVFAPAIEQEEVQVLPLSMTSYGRACGYFYDLCIEGKLAHLDQYQLNDAVHGAVRRPLGETWAWQRRAGVNLTPLVAATVAVWTAGTRVPDLVPMIH